jgi:uroporphyrinogen decarboxylase
MVRQALPANVPLIGFCGGPFTVASYAIEGHGSRDYIHTKTLMYTNSAAWHALMGKLATALGAYLGGQVAAGASAVQLFDSWVGALSADDYRTYVLPHTKAVIAALPAGVPVIHFGTGTATLLEAMREAGGSVIGLDWRVRLDEAWERIGYDRGVQGNLDPAVLLAGPQFIREKAVGVLNQAAGRPGHIFNLGHGVFRQTPVENVRYLVDVVHEFSSHGARR